MKDKETPTLSIDKEAEQFPESTKTMCERHGAWYGKECPFCPSVHVPAPQPQATQEKQTWEEVKSEDHWLEVKDPDGWYEATVKWDGCIHYTKYSNDPMSEDEENQDYLHICDIQGEIDRLYSLLQVARSHYKNHHYFDTAFAKEPQIIAQAKRQEGVRILEVVEGMLAENEQRKRDLPMTNTGNREHQLMGYSDALSDLTNIINETPR